MYKYCLAHNSPEDQGEIILLHEDNISDEDFRELVLKYTPEAFSRYRNYESETVSELRREFPQDDTPFPPMTWEFMKSYVGDLLCEKEGFRKLSVPTEKRFSAFGWSSVEPGETGWQQFDNQNNHLIREAIKKAKV